MPVGITFWTPVYLTKIDVCAIKLLFTCSVCSKSALGGVGRKGRMENSLIYLKDWIKDWYIKP